MVSIRSVLLSAAITLPLVSAAPTARPDQSPNEALVFRRQNDPNSVCSTFGVDIQDGGEYFVNTLSEEDFSSVSQFEGCNNDTANVLLINAETGDEYMCDDIRTVPDDTSLISTCPVPKSELTSGNYILLLLGNNGDGQPFAAQRDFVITAGPQQTLTVTPTTTLTITETPITSVLSTSLIMTTTSVNNSLTITKPARTEYITITPATATTTETKWLTHTKRTWTTTEDVITEIVTPSCTIPPPQQSADPPCLFEPTLVAMPHGISIPGTKGKRPMDIDAVRKRFQSHWNRNNINKRTPGARNYKRDIDIPTTTVTATNSANETTTVYAPTSTDLDITVATTTQTITLPPQTIRTGTKSVTTFAPTPYETEHRIRHTKVYVTKTFEFTRTETTTTTPGPDATACKTAGGHFGEGFGHYKWEKPKSKGKGNSWW